MAKSKHEIGYKITAKNATKGDFKQVDRDLIKITQAAKFAGAALGGIGLAKLASDFLDAHKRFQKLEASLITVTGSQEAANAAFAKLEEFTKKTPFLLDEVVGSFIKMKALGLDPTEAALTSFGNTASGMGKSLDQMVEAVADAVTGEFERLKEFGIKARQQGDNVTLTFKGVSTTIKKESGAIQEYLQHIGDTDFAGGMTRQMDTLGGAISNLSGKYDSLWANIGKTSAGENLADTVQSFSETISSPAFITGMSIVVQTATALAAASAAGVEFLGQAASGFERPVNIQNDATQRMMVSTHGLGTTGGGSAPALQTSHGAGAAMGSAPEDIQRSIYGYTSSEANDAMLADYQAYTDHQAKKIAAEQSMNQWRRAEKQGMVDFEIYENQRLADLEMQTQQNRQAATQNFFTNLRSLSQNAGREGFEIAKIAGVAETVINTRKAAMGAYAALAGIPYIGPALGAAAAAAAIAAGAAQIKGITSASYGGSGSVSAVTGTGGGTPTSPVVTQPQGTTHQGPSTITVNVNGDIIDYERWTETTLAPIIRDLTDRNVDFGLTVNRS